MLSILGPVYANYVYQNFSLATLFLVERALIFFLLTGDLIILEIIIISRACVYIYIYFFFLFKMTHEMFFYVKIYSYICFEKIKLQVNGISCWRCKEFDINDIRFDCNF